MNKLAASAKGVYLIAVTPFAENGALDLASTDRMVDFYLDRGATGLCRQYARRASAAKSDGCRSSLAMAAASFCRRNSRAARMVQ